MESLSKIHKSILTFLFFFLLHWTYHIDFTQFFLDINKKNYSVKFLMHQLIY